MTGVLFRFRSASVRGEAEVRLGGVKDDSMDG